MRFFADISTCEGQPMETNQQLVLHQLYMNPELRRTYLLQCRQFTDEELAGHFKQGARMDLIDGLDWYKKREGVGIGRDGKPLFETVPEQVGGTVRHVLGSGKERRRLRHGAKPSFIGQEQIDGDGFPVLWVSWSSPGGTGVWQEGDCARMLDQSAGGASAGKAAAPPLFHSADNLALNGWSKPNPAAPSHKVGRRAGGNWMLPTVPKDRVPGALVQVPQCSAADPALQPNSSCVARQCSCAASCVEWVRLTQFAW